MALNRDWYNTLVDDDGSGLYGSVWDKADVNSLMEVIDLEFARLVNGGIFTPTLTSQGGGAPLYTVQLGMWAKAGTITHVAGRIAISSKGSLASGSLIIAGFPATSYSHVLQTSLQASYFSGCIVPVVNIGGYTDPNTSWASLIYGPPGGSGNSVGLEVGHIGPTFDIVFSGSYITF